MKPGVLGALVITLALMGAIFAGSIGLGSGEQLTTTYSKVSDLAPVMSYSQVTGDEAYNPIGNTTGWSNVQYKTQTAPSIYTQTTAGTSTSATSGTFSSQGGSYYASDAVRNVVSTGYNYSYTFLWTPSAPGTEEQDTMIGGYTLLSQSNTAGQYGIRVSCTVTITDGTTAVSSTDSTPIYFRSLNEVAIAESWADGTIVAGTGAVTLGSAGVGIDGGQEFKGESSFSTTYGRNIRSGELTQRYTATTSSYWWNLATQTFYPITSTDSSLGPVTSSTPTSLLWWTSSLTDTLALTVYTRGTVTYVTPYSDVTITGGTTGTWANGYDNTEVQLLVQPGATITVGGYTFRLPYAASHFSRVLVTLGSGCTWQGVTSYNSTTDYTLADAQPLGAVSSAKAEEIDYTLNRTNASYGTLVINATLGSYISITYNGAINTALIGDWQTSNSETYTEDYEGGVMMISYLYTADTIATAVNYHVIVQDATEEVSLSSIDKITVSYSDTGTAYIVNTRVPADPNSLLWNNPHVDLNRYFPETVQNGARVTISSVIQTGSSLIINSQQFETADGKITIDGKTYPLADLQVTYLDNKVTMTAGSTTKDLGELQNSTISGAGTWYFTAQIDAIGHASKTVTTIKFGDGASENWYLFAFIGLCIAGLAVLVAMGRDRLSMLDWIVVIAGICIGIVLIGSVY